MINYIGRKFLKIKEKLDLIDKKDTVYGITISRYERYQALLNLVQQEASIRKLDLAPISNGSNLPFKKDGQWMIWKEGDRQPSIIPNSIDFIKDLSDCID